MAVYINPFDFKEILVNTFLGGTNLLIFALIFVYSFVSAKVQMSGRLYMILLFILAMLFAAFMGQGIYIIMILIFGLISFRVLSRLFT